MAEATYSRRWLLASLSGSVMMAAPGRIQAGSQTNAWPIDPQKPETLSESLRAIEQLKFAGFETGFRNVLPLRAEAAAFRRRYQPLQFFGVHIFLAQYDEETRIAPLELGLQVAEAGAAMGAQRLITSGAPAGDAEAARRKADGLNGLARAVKERTGLPVAYHNHGPEFQAGGAEMEALLAGTDSSAVQFLLDAGHAFRAGADVPAFVQKHSDRVAGLHLRDFRAGQQVPLGQGDFPLRQVAAALAGRQWSGWVLAEEEREDGSKPAERAIAPARQAIARAFGV